MPAMTLELVRHYEGGHCDLIAQFAAQELAYPMQQALIATYPGTAFVLRPWQLKNNPAFVVIRNDGGKLETVAQFERPYRFIAEAMVMKLGTPFALQELKRGMPNVKLMIPSVTKPGTWEQMAEKSMQQNEAGIFVPKK